jgi:hypothetical protein
MNPADDEPAEITGCVGESFETDERGGMAAIDSVDRRRFDRQVAIHESGHVVASYMLLSVAGSSIEFIAGHHGLTWSDDADLDPGTTSIQTICSELKPLMAGALADEVEQAHCHCIEYLAGITAEKLFCDGELLPNTGHDLEAATAIAELICRSPSSIDAYLAFALGRGDCIANRSRCGRAGGCRCTGRSKDIERRRDRQHRPYRAFLACYLMSV